MGGRLPGFMGAIVPVNTDKQLAELEARLAGDPEWHGGRYYARRRARRC